MRKSPKDWTPLPECNYDVAESIAAISTNIGLSKKHMKAYHAAEDSMGGFVGFYQVGVEMGIALEGYAKRNHIKWGEGADWIDATFALADAILDFMIEHGRLPKNDAERNGLIKASIVRD